MTPYQYLTKLWSHAPFSWAIIRANELLLLEKETFKPPILEVGCGDGIVSSLLFKNKKGIIDIGIDLDRSELKRAEKTKIYKKLIQADITNTEFASNSFNTIFTNGVLEHIPDLESALNEISRLLKKDGKLITTSPNTPGLTKCPIRKLKVNPELIPVICWIVANIPLLRKYAVSSFKKLLIYREIFFINSLFLGNEKDGSTIF